MQPPPSATSRTRSRFGWNQDLADVFLGLGLGLLAGVTVVANGIAIDLVGGALLALQTLPVMVRRRNPILVLCATGVGITLYGMLGYRDANGSLGVFVAFYTVAANEPRERALVAALITAVGILITFASYAAFTSLAGWTAGLTVNYLLFGFAWLIGDNLRVRRAYTRELEERAAALERGREEKADAAVTEERARIARELHDVVAHYVSVAVVQASGARRVLDRDPEAARVALEAVETAGRTALTEMRRMLEVLRASDSGLGPQPGLGELGRLTAFVRDAGVPVELSVQGDMADIPAGVDLAAYRIVQEALTNTVKHAGKASAKVRVTRGVDALEIEVTDDGRGAAAPLIEGDRGGHGLIGMKERVALFGGTLDVGPIFPGGWRVHARLPLDTDEGVRANGRAVPAGGSHAPESPDVEPADRGRRRPAAASLIEPRVVPPIIGRVVPPRPVPLPETAPRRERGGDL